MVVIHNVFISYACAALFESHGWPSAFIAKQNRSMVEEIHMNNSKMAISIEDITARKTADGKVSVIDVIADITKKDFNYAAKMYRRLLEEERVPHCECRELAPRIDISKDTKIPTKGVGRGNASSHKTPVATVHEMIEIIWQLPGTADFRKRCADLIVRYLGGDQSLITEIEFNRRSQEDLALTQPDHPARLFGEATEQTSNANVVAP